MFPALRHHLNLANAITSLSLAASAGALWLAHEGKLVPALCVAALSLACDVLDGAVARRTGTASPFGAQLDSLVDAIAFGVTPAILGFALGVRGPWVLLLLLYALAAVWRLARFAELAQQPAGDTFEGLPTTLCAALFSVVAALAPQGLPIFFALAAVAMNLGVKVPKRGLHTRALWLLVPASLAYALWQS